MPPALMLGNNGSRVIVVSFGSILPTMSKSPGRRASVSFNAFFSGNKRLLIANALISGIPKLSKFALSSKKRLCSSSVAVTLGIKVLKT